MLRRKSTISGVIVAALMLSSIATPTLAAVRVCLMKPTQVTTNNVG